MKHRDDGQAWGSVSADHDEAPWYESPPSAMQTPSSEQPPLSDSAWRTGRHPNRTRKRSRRHLIPHSPQELQIWLQQGGWLYITVAAIFSIILLVMLLSMNRGMVPNPFEYTATHEDSSRLVGATDVANNSSAEPPTLTPVPLIIEPPKPMFIVVNTGEYGLFVRTNHSSDSDAIETLRDGTVVEQIGDDVIGDPYTWRPVRTPSGREGWVATQWLQPAP